MGVTTSSNAYNSAPNQLTDKVFVPSDDWATLDGGMILGRTILQADGSPFILQGGFILGTSKLGGDTSQRGWIGSENCGNVQNAFSSPYPQINITFTGASLRRCRIAFDNIKGEYATEFTVITKLAGVVNSTTSITDNTLTYREIIFGQLNIDEIQVIIYKWSKPFRNAKVMEFNIISDILLENISISASGTVVNNKVCRIRKGNSSISATGILSNLLNFVRIRPKGISAISATGTVSHLINFPRIRKDGVTAINLSGVLSQLISFVRTRKNNSNSITATGTTGLNLVNRIRKQGVILISGVATVVSSAKKYKGTKPIVINGIATMRAVAIRMFTWQGPFPITSDNYKVKENPVDSSTILNNISVKSIPLTLSNTEELYNSDITNNGKNTIIVNFSEDKSPVKEGIVSLKRAAEDLPPLYTSIVSSYIYSKSAFVTINSTQEEDVRIIIKGKYLQKTGSQSMPAKDEGSILENGNMAYELPENHLIQTPEIAQKIADLILDISKDDSKDMTLVWRGNPAVELSDTVEIEEFGTKNNFVVIRQEINYDGALSSSMKGRKK